MLKPHRLMACLEAEPSGRRRCRPCCCCSRRRKRATLLRRGSRRGCAGVKCPLQSQTRRSEQDEGSYLDLSDGAGGDLVVLQRGGRDGPAAVERLGERRHLGSGGDLHAGELGGVQLLQGGEKEGGVSVEELGQTLRVLYSVLPSVCLRLPPNHPLPLSFASPLPRLPTFHEVGREPPSKVLTVFQRQDPERDSSLKKPHRDGFLSKILGAPVFHSSQRKSLPNWMRVCWSRFFGSLDLDLHGFLLKCSFFFVVVFFFSFLLCPVMCLQSGLASVPFYNAGDQQNLRWIAHRGVRY